MFFEEQQLSLVGLMMVIYSTALFLSPSSGSRQSVGVKMCDQKHVRQHGDMINSDDGDQLSASDESEPEQQPSRAPFDPDLDHSDDDDDDDVCAPAAIPISQSSFSLSGGTSAFSDRSHSIFDCLDSIGRQTFSSLNQNTVADESSLHSQNTSHPSSICPTPPKKRLVPDYLVHPERWTHYSLEDVNESSDQENSRVAYQFLSSLGQEARGSSPCDLQHKMIFRPKQLPKEQPNDQLSLVSAKETGMHLSHLLEEEEEDEEAEGRKTEEHLDKTEKGQKDEEKDTSGAMGQGEEKKEVQKEKKVEESRCQFTSFRNMMTKNYRKRPGCEDN